MKLRRIGRSELLVAPLAFGGNVFGWTVEQATAFHLLDAFVGAGFNLIDTADIYPKWVPGNQGGESETIIGNWLKQRGNRDQVIIATKLGMEMAPDKKGLSRDYIFRAVEDSLRRLQTDYIDLYQAHQDDLETPLIETLSAFGDLLKQGKVRAIGASNYSAERLAEAERVSNENLLPRYECLQPLYNLYDRAVFEEQLEPLCLEEEIGVISFYSLAAGFLTGKYRSENDLAQSARGAGIGQKYLNDRGLQILEALDQVARQYNANPARVSLAWLLARPSVTAPIASATSLAQLNELIAATQLELDQAAIELLNQASAEPRSKSATN